MFNTTIEGHDEIDPMDEDDDALTPGETESASKVWKVSPEEAIMGEKCIVFTHVLMSLLTDHYASICRREGCGRALQYRKTYVGTCLLVSWRCSAGQFGGRWAAQPTC